MRTGFFGLCLIASFALSLESAHAQQPAQQQPGIQPSQPQQPQQQQQQAQAPAYSSNNGNYAGAPLTQFDPNHLQGQWVSQCMQQFPQYWPSAGPIISGSNTFRRFSYTFDAGRVIFAVEDFRDFNCSVILSVPHTESGSWINTMIEPTQPTAGEMEFIYDGCSGVGCHSYNPDAGPYSISRAMVTLVANRLFFGHRLPGGVGIAFDVNEPLFIKGTEPTALPSFQSP